MKYGRDELKAMAIAFESARENFENAGKCLRLLNELMARTGLPVSICLDKIRDMARG